MKNLRLAFLLLVPTFFAPSCSSTPTGFGDRVPVQHRASATACSMTRPPGPTASAGQCKSDSDCTDSTQGTNGRCVYSRIGPSCSYDKCFDDSACMGKVCICRPDGQTVASAQANYCASQGNCRIDGDCGPGGTCSPTLSTCGTYTGVVGYYCHTPQDTCLDDADCKGSDASFGGPGYCMFSPEGAKWICSYTQCAG